MPKSDSDVVSSIQRHVAMTWAQRLKRVVNIDIEVCSRCGGSARVIACIEDQDVIDKILAHLREKEQATRIVCKGATGNYITVVGSCPPGYTFVSIAKD